MAQQIRCQVAEAAQHACPACLHVFEAAIPELFHNIIGRVPSPVLPLATCRGACMLDAGKVSLDKKNAILLLMQLGLRESASLFCRAMQSVNLGNAVS